MKARGSRRSVRRACGGMALSVVAAAGVALGVAVGGSSASSGSPPPAFIGKKGAGPTNVAPPKVGPTSGVGTSKYFSCSDGKWKPKPKSIKRQWTRDGVAIPGATDAKYAITAADVGHVLACLVTATTAGGSTTATSNSWPISDPSGVYPTLWPNHFKCYHVREQKIRAQRIVQLQDQFANGQAQVRRPMELCNPAQKDYFPSPPPFRQRRPPRLPGRTFAAHLVCYQVLNLQAGAPVQPVIISNQFGDTRATVLNAETLCVPSLKRGVAQPGATTGPAPSGPDPATLVDHYRCWRVIATPRSPAITRHAVLDQFGFTYTRVVRMDRLCAPVSKNNEGIKQPLAHLACYLIHDEPNANFFHRYYVVRNQFGVESLFVEAVSELCVPSFKTVVNNTPPPTMTTTTTTTTTPVPKPNCMAQLLTTPPPNNLQLRALCDKAIDRWKLVLPAGVSIRSFQVPPSSSCTGTGTSTLDCTGAVAANTQIGAVLATNPPPPPGASFFDVFYGVNEADFPASGP